jgi:hypothetical protein
MGELRRTRTDWRLSKLGLAVDRKLAIVHDTYTALYEEASSRRAELALLRH